MACVLHEINNRRLSAAIARKAPQWGLSGVAPDDPHLKSTVWVTQTLFPLVLRCQEGAGPPCLPHSNRPCRGGLFCKGRNRRARAGTGRACVWPERPDKKGLSRGSPAERALRFAHPGASCRGGWLCWPEGFPSPPSSGLVTRRAPMQRGRDTHSAVGAKSLPVNGKARPAGFCAFCRECKFHRAQCGDRRSFRQSGCVRSGVSDRSGGSVRLRA